MKACSVALAAHIAQGQTTLTTLFKITRQPDGLVMGFTEHDQNLVFGGVTYLSTSGYNRFNLNETSDGESKSTELVGAISPPSSPVVNTDITRADLEAHLYDYAQIQLLLVNWADLTMGAIILGTGSLGPVTIEEFQFRVEVRGLGYALNDVGGEYCCANCRTDFGSPKCAPGGLLDDGTDINSLLQTGTVVSTDGKTTIVFSGLTNNNKPDGGNVTFASGSNDHLSSEIKHIDWATSTITLKPGAMLLAAIAPGDTFAYFPGCDFTEFTCSSVYNNIINFQGEPNAPTPDAVLDYPDFVAPGAKPQIAGG